MHILLIISLACAVLFSISCDQGDTSSDALNSRTLQVNLIDIDIRHASHGEQLDVYTTDIRSTSIRIIDTN